MTSSFQEGSLTKLCLSIVIVILLLPISNVSGSNSDFDNATPLESGATHEGIIEADDIYFSIEAPIGHFIKFEFHDLDEQWLEFCVYDGNTSSDNVECSVPENNGPGTLFEKATSNTYFVKIYCSECEGHGGDARFSLSATLLEDEAGDSIQSATYLSPESMVYGTIHGSESDFYSTPVMNGDSIRLVITDEESGAMTSYRLYDNYGIKIAEEWELADYDFTVVAENDGNLTVELLCAFEGVCDYSLIAIGSTYIDSSAQDSEVTEEQSSGGALTNSLFTTIAVVVGLLVIVGLILRNRSESPASVQPSIQNEAVNDEIQRLQQTVTQAELEKTHIQDELKKAKSTTVVQNITYNIQDSAIAGDLNATRLKEKDD
jgi:hypothetical protein